VRELGGSRAGSPADDGQHGDERREYEWSMKHESSFREGSGVCRRAEVF